MSQKYVLRLTTSDRQGLHQIAKGRGGHRRPPGWKMERARALLQCDEGPEGEGWPDAAIAAALDVSARSVSRWHRQTVEAGPAAALARQPKVPRARRLDGAGEAQLLQLAQSTPPAGQARWTLRALARELVTRGIASRISYETVRRVLKKELTPWRRVQRCYPPVPPEADFVSRMEAVLNRYSWPYDPRYPVICRDEHAKFLRADKWPSQPARPGRPATYDYAYVRCGTGTIGMFVEPLARGAWPTPPPGARPWTGRTRSRPWSTTRATARPSA